MKRSDHVNIYDLLQDTSFTPESKSEYINSLGIRVPRVTEILSRMIHNDGLMYWANSLGFKGIKYRDALNQAAKAGTECHSLIERFLKEKFQDSSNIPFQGFLSWYDIITKDAGLPIEAIYVERKLVCNWFGGTLDALLKIGEGKYLTDFKTSNHVTFNYFLQLAAYRFMLRIIEGIIIDGVIVLQLDKEEVGFKEFVLDFSNPDHLNFINQCENTFLSLVYAFYNLEEVRINFNSIF